MNHDQFELTKHFGEFAAAHVLQDHDGGCANLHGHNYGVSVTVTGNLTDPASHKPDSGMIIDFTTLKAIYKDRIHSVLDHAYILPQVLDYQPAWYRDYVSAVMRRDGVGLETASHHVRTKLGKVAHLRIDSTTAEAISKWIAVEFQVALLELGHFAVNVVKVEVTETLTSAAVYYMTPAHRAEIRTSMGLND